MADVPDVFVIGSIKMLAQIGEVEKIVELCNEWLDKFESRPTPLAPDAAPHCANCCILCEHENCTETCHLCKRGAGKA